MKLVALSLAIAVTMGYLLGGRLSRLSDLKVRYAPVAFAGLLLQVVNPPGRWPLVMLLTSFLLLTIFVVLNLRTRGFPMILVGVLMNFTVIAVNGGMPVDRQAIVASGQADTFASIIEQRGVKHHLAEDGDRLLFLGDVIAIPPPIAQVISIGDVLAYGGVAVVVAAAMRRRPRSEGVAPAREVGRVAV